MRLQLRKGAQFPLDNITEEARVQDLVGFLQRGNHKSAEKFLAFLEKAMAKKVAKG